MAIGVPRDSFWAGDRDLIDDYERAFECKQILMNKQLHLQGLYNHQAFGSVLSQAFAQKGQKGKPYPVYPFAITETERKEEKKRNILRTLQFVRGRKRDKNVGSGKN